MKRKNRYLSLFAAVGISLAAAFPVTAAFEDSTAELLEQSFQVEETEDAEETLPLGEAESTEREEVPDGEVLAEPELKEEPAETEMPELSETLKDGKAEIKTGWQKQGGKYYYYREDGKPAKGRLDLSGASYFLDVRTGERCEGWVQGARYRYFAKADGRLVSGWQKLDGKWYYFYPKSKAMAVGKKTLSNGKTYFFDSKNGQMKEGWTDGASCRYYAVPGSGELAGGWQKLSGSWYYFYPKSRAMAKGLKKIEGTYYYLSQKNGVMKTGWQEINGSWYYFKGSGAIHKGWLQLGNTNYYLNGSGKMYQNEKFSYNGLTCIADAGGAVTMQSKAAQYALKTLNQTGWDLRAAFRWSAGLTYYRPTPTPPAGVRHSEHYAVFGFENRMGNCYVMADTFYFMAKLLGYEVYNVEGLVPLARGGMGPHGWTEIVINGTTYVFDPNFTNETGRNGYQIYYGMSGTWRYSNYHRAN